MAETTELFDAVSRLGKILPLDEKPSVAQASVEEARRKINSLKQFYKDPFDDGSERWWLAEFCLDYLQQFKYEGTKRKDGITEDVLHEINQLFLHKSFIHAPKNPYYEIRVLPREVTFEMVNGKRKAIPAEARSIELLFCGAAIHDIDEDFPDSSPDSLKAYLRGRIMAEPQIPQSQKDKLNKSVDVLAQAMKNLTFGRKTRDSAGNVVKEITFDNDRNLYMDAVESLWISAAVKPPDKLDSLTSRYGHYADYFTIEKDILHLDETYRMFKIRQMLENMKDRYPELSEFFTVVNAKMSVAERCLQAMTLHHPSKLKQQPDPSVRPETAKIDVSRFLEAATRYSQYLEEDCKMLVRMLRSFQAEAQRHPSLQNLVTQMTNQFEPYLKKYEYKSPFHPDNGTTVDSTREL